MTKTALERLLPSPSPSRRGDNSQCLWKQLGSQQREDPRAGSSSTAHPSHPPRGAETWVPLQLLDSFSPPGRPGLKYLAGGLSTDRPLPGRQLGEREPRPRPTLALGPLQRARVTQAAEGGLDSV